MSPMRLESGHQRTKRPLNPVAGPTGHPFHPVFVTVPIGAWIASIVFDLISRTADNPEVFAIGAHWLIGIGIVGAVVAAAFGLMDLLVIPTGTPAHRTGLIHMSLNVAVLVAFAVSFFLRRGDTDGEVSIGLIVLSAIALAALGLSGWLGGKLTYRYGVRVVEDEAQADGFAQPDR
jgi:uncharacterized membrane protein